MGLSELKQLPNLMSGVDNARIKLGWPLFCLYYFLLILLPTGVFSYFNYRQVEGLKQNLSLNLNVEGVVNGVSSNAEPSKPESTNTTNSPTRDINPEDWIIDKDRFSLDQDGFYCREKRLVRSAFPIASIWTRATYTTSKPVSFTLKVKSIGKQTEPPTVSITYGQYELGRSPQQIYRLAIFENDMRTIRLYDDKNRPSATNRLTNDPEIGNDVTIQFDSRLRSNTDRTLFLDPTVKYAVFDDPNVKTDHFTDMNVIVPSVDSSIKYQYGLGIKEGTCVKILSPAPTE